MDRFKILERPEYKDLADMKDDIILLGLSGSHSYGTNIESSDIDIRGIRYNSLQMILGLEKPGQYISSTTDTTIYDLNKVIPLLAQCNPNIIEMLGLSMEDEILLDPVGASLEFNANMFLSKDCVKNAFGGYAKSQLYRLRNGESDGHGQKKDDAHLCKHAMHLIRLLLMGTEILMTGQIHTRRSNSELEFLMKIRNGQYLKDGKMISDFYTLVDILTGAMDKAYAGSKLPEKPDWDRINRFLMNVNYATILKKCKGGKHEKI